ncbi:hypothetical protein KJ840_04260 [Patescibacteria group bacterium]|nr:hypothetical protein [Patescibacteria group bacterium]
MKNKQFYSTVEVGKLLGISRIAVFKRIKSGKIKAKKVGRNYVIDRANIENPLIDTLNERTKSEIDKAIKKTIKEYGETLKMLAHED